VLSQASAPERIKAKATPCAVKNQRLIESDPPAYFLEELMKKKTIADRVDRLQMGIACVEMLFCSLEEIPHKTRRDLRRRVKGLNRQARQLRKEMVGY
jgi:hypothetical protein